MNERELNVHTTRTSTRLPTRYCYYYCLLLFNRSIFQILLQVRLERVPVMLILVLASLVLVLVLVSQVLVLASLVLVMVLVGLLLVLGCPVLVNITGGSIPGITRRKICKKNPWRKLRRFGNCRLKIFTGSMSFLSPS